MSKKTDDLVKEIKETENKSLIKKSYITTGSTLLDLAISGKANWEGGIPSGTFTELYGVEGSGKTAILMEIASAIRKRDGKIKIADVERRLNKEYAKVYGLEIDPEEYCNPKTIEEFFEILHKFPEDSMNLLAGDSLSMLSTEQELKQGDKMGTLRSKIFSQEIRKAIGVFGDTKNFIVCTNQARDNVGGYGETITTSGGRALRHQASIRIKISQRGQLKTSKTINGKVIEKVYGIESECKIVKNSEDSPYRTAPIYIVFDYGLDDIRANLEYLKDFGPTNKYEGDYSQINKAIEFIENGGEEAVKLLREKVINLWHEIESKFDKDRIRKIR